MFICVINLIGSITHNKNQINYLQIKLPLKTQHNGLSSRTKSSISIDLFNLPPLLDTRKQSMMMI